MRIAILTNEYPPYVYGGAGVHVDNLTREMTGLGNDVIKVLCFGDQNLAYNNLQVNGINRDWPVLAKDKRDKVLKPLAHNLIMAGQLEDVDLVHCHTWYTHFAGCLVQELLEVPLLLTTHSLEPHRPWKADQLGSGYRVSTWLERIAYQKADGIIAVSEAMKEDVSYLYQVEPQKIRVIHNGIDPDEYKPIDDKDLLIEHGLDPEQPYILFVGRITAQKGIVHLLRAIPFLDPNIQVLLCAASPDTPELDQVMSEETERLKRSREAPVVWRSEPVTKAEIIPLYTQASAFVCPSIYEPFGIINLEAMACQTPVVASRIGGIPEIVEHGQSGFLIPFAPTSLENPEPKDPEAFARKMAEAINEVCLNKELQTKMGRYARKVVEKSFSWSFIAQKTLEFYRQVVDQDQNPKEAGYDSSQGLV